MTRQEMIELRKELVEQADQLRKIGDYGAGASDIRALAERLLKITDHLLERMRA